MINWSDIFRLCIRAFWAYACYQMRDLSDVVEADAFDMLLEGFIADYERTKP